MNRALIVVISFVLAGCGISAADSAEYQQSLAELEAAVVEHEADAAQDCSAEHRRYDERARPRLGQMTRMAGTMDGTMRSMCGSMQSELDRHATSACAGEAAANRAETLRHCQVMREWLAQQQSCSPMMGRCGR